MRLDMNVQHQKGVLCGLRWLHERLLSLFSTCVLEARLVMGCGSILGCFLYTCHVTRKEKFESALLFDPTTFAIVKMFSVELMEPCREGED